MQIDSTQSTANNGKEGDLTLPAKVYYSNPSVVKGYTLVGLFPAEEIILGKYLEPGHILLDVGCGTGRTSIPLAKRGYRVTAIDLVPEMIDVARRQALDHGVDVDFQVMNAVQMNFPPQSFEYVLFSFNGFDHILGRKNREKFLKDVYELLMPGGFFVLTSRSGVAFSRRMIAWCWMIITHPWQKHRWGRGYELGDKRFGEMHMHYTSPFHLRSLVKTIGFSVEYFNSEQRIVLNKPPSFFTNFSSDRMLFFVLRKQPTGQAS